MSTVQHKVDMFNLANERRNTGKPSWAYTVQGFKAALESFDEDNFIEVRDKVVAIIKASRWYREADEYGELWQVIDGRGLQVADGIAETVADRIGQVDSFLLPDEQRFVRDNVSNNQDCAR